MEKNRVEVIIGGRKYALLSEDNSEYIEKVAKEVNSKIEEIELNCKSLGYDKKAILAALNLADDKIKTENKLAEVLEELKLLKKPNTASKK